MEKIVSTLSCICQKFSSLKYPFEAHISKYAFHHNFVHTHDFPQLFYCLDGEYIHTVDETSYQCEKGSLIIVPPGKNHSYRIKNGKFCSVVQVNVLLNFFDNLEDERQVRTVMHIFLSSFSNELKFDFSPYIQFHGEEKELASKIFTRLASYEWKGYVADIVPPRNLFCEIFAFSPFALSQKSLSLASNLIVSKYIPVLRTIYYMNLYYSEKITSEDMSAVSNICRTDYFRYFRRFFGTTYTKYLSRIRVFHAIILCRFTRLSFSYIADICGFCDHAHMDVQMRKCNNGLLPGDLRKGRDANIANFPFMIKSREEYEKPLSFFHSYGL